MDSLLLFIENQDVKIEAEYRSEGQRTTKYNYKIKLLKDKIDYLFSIA